MIVCICHGINDRTLRKAVDDGASTMSDLVSATGVSVSASRYRLAARSSARR